MSVVVCAPVVVVPAAVVPDAIAPTIELLTVFKYHEYPVGAMPVPGAAQLNDQLLSPEIVRFTLLAGLGIPTAVDVNCPLFVPVVTLDVNAVR